MFTFFLLSHHHSHRAQPSFDEEPAVVTLNVAQKSRPRLQSGARRLPSRRGRAAGGAGGDDDDDAGAGPASAASAPAPAATKSMPLSSKAPASLFEEDEDDIPARPAPAPAPAAAKVPVAAKAAPAAKSALFDDDDGPFGFPAASPPKVCALALSLCPLACARNPLKGTHRSR
jgi:hypothetical protein